MRFLKLAILLLPILPCSFITAQEVESEKKVEWKKFTSEESGFKVELPTIPDHMNQKIDIPKTDVSITYDTYISEPSDKVVYVISVWHYPKEVDMSQPEVNLQDGFKGMLSALPNAKVLRMDMGEQQGYKALDFNVQHEEVFFEGKLILVHNTLYQVFTVYKESAKGMQTDVKHFVNSFSLIHPEQNRLKEEGIMETKI